MVHRFDVLLAFSAFLVSLTVYILTLCPTVYVGDSAELSAAAYTLGIAHNPGYPLYVLLGHLFTWIPVGEVAFRTNLFSALVSSLTVLFLYLSVRYLLKNSVVAFATSLIFAFTLTFWSRSTITEVYTFYVFFLSVLFYLLFRWDYQRDVRYLLLGAFLFGLGLGNHMLLVFLSPSLLLYFFLKDRSVLLNWRFLLAASLLVLLGFSVYVFLPIRSSQEPFLNWGNPTTLENLLKHFTGQPPEGFFIREGPLILSKLKWFVTQLLAKEFWYLGAVGMIGIYSLRRQKAELTLIITLFISIVTFTVLRRISYVGDFDAYFLGAHFAWVFLMGAGLDFVWRILSHTSFWTGAKAKVLGTAVSLTVPLVLFIVNFHPNDRSENYVARDYADNLVRSLEPGALVFVEGDEDMFLFWYLQLVDKKANDVHVISQYDLGQPWAREKLFSETLRITDPRVNDLENLVGYIIAAEVTKKPVFIAHEVKYSTIREKYSIVPRGFMMKISNKDSGLSYRPIEFVRRLSEADLVLDERSTIISNSYPNQRLLSAAFLQNVGRPEAAVTELKLLLDDPLVKSSVRRNAQFMLAQYLGHNKNYLDALSILDSIEPYFNSSSPFYEFRGDVLISLSDSAGARNDWQRGLQLDPLNRRLRSRMNR